MNLPGKPQDMLEKAKAMQERIKSEVATIRVSASTGGGMVTVKMNGNKQVTAVLIEEGATDDVEMLQDMVRGACNEASRRVDEQVNQKLGGMMGGLGLPGGLF